jgi:hypothetical protein
MLGRGRINIIFPYEDNGRTDHIQRLMEKSIVSISFNSLLGSEVKIAFDDISGEKVINIIYHFQSIDSEKLEANRDNIFEFINNEIEESDDISEFECDCEYSI